MGSFARPNNPNFYVDPAGISYFYNLRADIFYDRNNTAYYIDPASTSYLNDLRANIFFDRNNTSFYLNPASNSNLNILTASIFRDRNNTNFYLDPANSTISLAVAGRVGIGTTNPQTKLQVVGLVGSTAGAYLRYYTADGRIYYDASSLRYKTDIKPFRDDFYKILKLEPKSFTDKATGVREIGYIAEELDKLGLKSLIGYDKEGKPETIHYEKIILYLIEVVKEQQKRIEALEAKLNM